jgi:hypothetical protein
MVGNESGDRHRHEVTASCVDVNDLIGRLSGEALPALRLVHRDLASSQQSPQPHRGGFGAGPHRLRLDLR